MKNSNSRDSKQDLSDLKQRINKLNQWMINEKIRLEKQQKLLQYPKPKTMRLTEIHGEIKMITKCMLKLKEIILDQKIDPKYQQFFFRD